MNLLNVVRKNKISALRVSRDASVFGSFVFLSSTFDADQVSQTRILGLVIAVSAGAIPASGIQWRLADNSWISLLPTDIPSLFAALQSHIQSRFILFAQHESNINLMTDPDLIAQYNVEVF